MDPSAAGIGTRQKFIVPKTKVFVHNVRITMDNPTSRIGNGFKNAHICYTIVLLKLLHIEYTYRHVWYFQTTTTKQDTIDTMLIQSHMVPRSQKKEKQYFYISKYSALCWCIPAQLHTLLSTSHNLPLLLLDRNNNSQSYVNNQRCYACAIFMLYVLCIFIVFTFF